MEIRQEFLKYFEKNGHLIMPSSGLIPHGDPSVLLTTAGMQQFKPYYLGIKKPPAKRIATVQKCFRTSDIDSVGYTERHLTFFEMLGNFSFGDYFKKEAINYSLDFLLNNLGISLQNLYFTVFKGDKDIPADLESIKYWQEMGIGRDRIYQYGREENFWGPAGDTGPCGPCSEIHYDFGEEYGCGRKDCNPNCDCGRFLEIWNLVFTQYNFDGDKYLELPQKNIDTGMGLERITAVMEGTPSVFKTSLFSGIINKIEEISDSKNYKNYKKNKDKSSDDFYRAVRIIADHIRAIYFLIADGVVPSNEGRGYILRRIIRRTIRFGKLIGIKNYFLNDVGEVVIDKYSKVYPELLEKKDFAFRLVSDEEKRFTRTLKEGNKVLLQKISEIKKDKKEYLNPKDAFNLYDTFGFPVELTAEILKENNIKLDLRKFNDYVKEHTEKSRGKDIFNTGIDKDIELYREISKNIEVEFTGYQKYRTETVIEKIIKIDGDGSGTGTVSKKPVLELSEGEKGEIILKETPFYGERGGQVGDRGIITYDNNTFIVDDCTIPVEGIIVHKGFMEKGKLKVGDKVEAEIDRNRRKNISKNHTTTHILHWALRSLYGNEVKQSGSYVDEDRFRFDYTLYNAPSEEDINKIEEIVNKKIQNDDPVRCFETTREFAEEIGAVALFDEKYSKFVRVVEINNYSRELCGGTHVARTGEIGLCKIISDSSVGANLRRIEAVTGMSAYNCLKEKEKILKKASDGLEVEESKIPDAIEKMKEDLKRKEEQLRNMQIKIAKKEIIDKFKLKPGDNRLKIIDFDFSKSEIVPDIGINNIGMVGDEIINYFGGSNTFIVFGCISGEKSVVILNSTKDLVKKGIDCGKIAAEVSKKLNGRGGGKPGFAQMGLPDKNSIEKAIKLVREIVLEVLDK